jgi:hypothetical protein
VFTGRSGFLGASNATSGTGWWSQIRGGLGMGAPLLRLNGSEVVSLDCDVFHRALSGRDSE